MAEKEDFYDELDRKARRSYCTCQTFVLGLLVVILIAVAGAVALIKRVRTVVAPERRVEITNQDAASLQNKFADLQKAPGAATSLTITERELTSLLIQAISKNPNFPLREVQTEINPTEIILTGKAAKLWNSTLTVSAIPKVVDGKPILELVRIQAGTLDVPKPLTENLSKAIEGLLATELENLHGVTIKSIRLGEGQMRITGTLSDLSTQGSAPSSPGENEVE